MDSDQWNVKEINETLGALHPQLKAAFPEEKLKSAQDAQKLADQVEEEVISFYERKCAAHPPEVSGMAERVITLRSIDTHWMDHIDDMSHLREQVAFSGYAQRDPLIEYQDRAFQKFKQLIQKIDATIVRTLLQIDFAQFAPRQILREAEEELRNLQTNEDQIEGELTQTGVTRNAGQAMQGGSGALAAAMRRQQGGAPAQPQNPAKTMPKVGRNDPCPCGSGKKYKKCHGRLGAD
jgi:preprotein translocase subunit SecA